MPTKVFMAVHVAPLKGSQPRPQWAVTSGRHPARKLAWFPTQREAIVFARAEATRREVELIVHGRDGEIRAKDSYGPDSPRRPG